MVRCEYVAVPEVDSSSFWDYSNSVSTNITVLKEPIIKKYIKYNIDSKILNKKYNNIRLTYVNEKIKTFEKINRTYR